MTPCTMQELALSIFPRPTGRSTSFLTGSQPPLPTEQALAIMPCL